MPHYEIKPLETLTSAELAAMLKINKVSLLLRVRQGMIPAPSTIGGRIRGNKRWDRAVIEAWFRAGCPACEPPRG